MTIDLLQEATHTARRTLPIRRTVTPTRIEYLESGLVWCTARPEATRHDTSAASACQYPSSDKSVTFGLSRNATGGRSSHPLVPVTRHEIIDHIADGSRHQYTGVIQGPPPRELSDYPQSCSGLGIDTALFQQEEGLIVRSGQMQVAEDMLRLFRLECPELEHPVWITRNRKAHPGIAPLADPVEENQPLVLRPFMHGGIKLVCH